MSQSTGKEVYSQRKIASNRRNALRSTGPRSPEGKQMSRWNAQKHGMLAKELVIPAGDGKEDENEFRALLESLRDDLRPVGLTEEILVEEIAVAYWRLRRVIRSENGRIQQAFHRDARWDQILKVEPKADEIALQHARMALLQGSDAKEILRYGGSMERVLFRALRCLERRQKDRREQSEVRSQKSEVGNPQGNAQSQIPDAGNGS